MKRKARIRAKVLGTRSRPRLVVYRSNKAMSVQMIDDEKGHTIIAKTIRGTTRDTAKLLGADIAKASKSKGIARAVFDRGGYRYHGAVRQLVESAREGGLEI